MNYFIKFMTFYAVILLILAFLWRFVSFMPIGYLWGDVIVALGDLNLYLAFGTAFAVTAFIVFWLYIFQRF